MATRKYPAFGINLSVEIKESYARAFMFFGADEVETFPVKRSHQYKQLYERGFQLVNIVSKFHVGLGAMKGYLHMYLLY